MTLRTYRVPSEACARTVQVGLRREGVDTKTGIRRRCSYVAVRSERGDVDALVRRLEPLAVPVNVEHLPTPAPDEKAFF